MKMKNDIYVYTAEPKHYDQSWGKQTSISLEGHILRSG